MVKAGISNIKRKLTLICNFETHIQGLRDGGEEGTEGEFVDDV
jgi:hypothetical protein